MKSALELAMERFPDDDGPSRKPLTDAQKEALAELDRKFEAKIAEREVFLEGKLQEARIQRNREDIEQIQTQLRNERIRLTEEKEAAKNRIRNEALS